MIDQLFAGALHCLFATRKFAVYVVQQIGSLKIKSTEGLDVQFGQIGVQASREKLVVLI